MKYHGIYGGSPASFPLVNLKDVCGSEDGLREWDHCVLWFQSTLTPLIESLMGNAIQCWCTCLATSMAVRQWIARKIWAPSKLARFPLTIPRKARCHHPSRTQYQRQRLWKNLKETSHSNRFLVWTGEIEEWPWKCFFPDPRFWAIWVEVPLMKPSLTEGGVARNSNMFAATLWKTYVEKIRKTCLSNLMSKPLLLPGHLHWNRCKAKVQKRVAGTEPPDPQRSVNRKFPLRSTVFSGDSKAELAQRMAGHLMERPLQHAPDAANLPWTDLHSRRWRTAGDDTWYVGWNL